MTAYMVIIFGAVCTSSGAILMRYGGKDMDFSKGLFHVINTGYLWIFGLALGWVAGLAFAFVTTKLEISTAISYYIPLAYTITFWAGALILKEPLSFYRITGNILILLGLCFMLVKTS